MKSLIFLAAIILVASSQAFNSTTYHQGFFKQISFSQAQIQDAVSCSGDASFNNSVVLAFRPLYLALNKGSDAMATAAVQAVAEVQALASKSQCKAYVTDIQGFFWKQTTDPAQLKTLILANYNKHQPIVDAETTSWGFLLFSKDYVNAGIIAANVFQILLGTNNQAPHRFPSFRHHNRF